MDAFERRKELTISTEVGARDVPAYLREVFTSTSYRRSFD